MIACVSKVSSVWSLRQGHINKSKQCFMDLPSAACLSMLLPHASHSLTSYLRGRCVLRTRPSGLSPLLLPLLHSHWSSLLPWHLPVMPPARAGTKGSLTLLGLTLCFSSWSHCCGNMPGPPGAKAVLDLLLSSPGHLLHWRGGNGFLSFLLCHSGHRSLPSASCFQIIVPTVHRFRQGSS